MVYASPPSHAQMLHTAPMNPTVTIASSIAVSTCESDITEFKDTMAWNFLRNDTTSAHYNSIRFRIQN